MLVRLSGNIHHVSVRGIETPPQEKLIVTPRAFVIFNLMAPTIDCGSWS